MSKFQVSQIGILKEHTNVVTELIVHPYRMTLISSSEDGRIIIWEPKQCPGEEYAEWTISNDPFLEGHCAGVTGLCIVKDVARLVSCSKDKSIIVWDLNTGRLVRKICNIHDLGIRSVSMSLDGNKVITGSSDASIKVLDVRLNNMATKYANVFERAHPGPVQRVRMNPVYDSKYFFSCGATLKKWDMRVQSASRRTEDLNWQWQSLFDFSPILDFHLLEYGYDGVQLVCGGNSPPTVNVWNLSEAGDCTKAVWDLIPPVYKWSKSFESTTPLGCVKFSPDMRYLATGQGDKVYIWHLKFQRYVAKIKLDEDKNGQIVTATSMAWSFDVRYLFVGTSNGTIGVFKCFA